MAQHSNTLDDTETTYLDIKPYKDDLDIMVTN